MKQHSSASGVLAAASAFVCWGLLPLYWKAISGVPALEIICHRVVWSLVCTGLLLAFAGGFGTIGRALRSPRTLLLLACSSSLIAVNWFLYVWSVNAGHVLEASLGYYLNPLVNVVLGMAVFGDRLSRIQKIAVALAAAGVAVQLAAQGSLPWIALALAATFGLYGMVRKLMALESLPGLFVETLALTIPAGGWLAWLAYTGAGSMGQAGLATNLLLAGAGVVTTLPLLAFAFGARRITMTTLGVLQYLGPTGMLLLGVLVYGEPFGMVQAATFGLIWAGVILYTVDGLRKLRWFRKAG
jgi:chloramphenicol-sensitive protein RarD